MIRNGCLWYVLTWALALVLAPVGALMIVYAQASPGLTFVALGALGFSILGIVWPRVRR